MKISDRLPVWYFFKGKRKNLQVQFAPIDVLFENKILFATIFL